MSITKELESTLRLAFAEAKARRHENVTLEHLLYALLRDPVASASVAAAAFAREHAAQVAVDISTWTLVDDTFRERVRAIAPDVSSISSSSSLLIHARCPALRCSTPSNASVGSTGSGCPNFTTRRCASTFAACLRWAAALPRWNLQRPTPG